MLKRKYGDHLEWKRILKRNYSQALLQTDQFHGYITLLHTIKVTAPLSFTYGNKEICIVNDGYMWLQQFPIGKNHSVTTMFNENGEVVQWYIDICKQNGVTDNRPWMDDLFLDLIVLPSGEVFDKDAHEIEEAFTKGIIDKLLYDLAWKEFNEIKSLISEDKFDLIKFSIEHRDLLLNKIKNTD